MDTEVKTLLRCLENKNVKLLVRERFEPVPAGECDEARAEATLHFHRSLPPYRPTELKALPALAARLGVGGIYVKDESTRFGLKAFKGLGGSYAIFRVLCERLGLDPDQVDFTDFTAPERRVFCASLEFATATDGNHGKGVAWAARLFGSRAHVFMPKGTVEARRAAIESVGAAEVRITDGNYDETVDLARRLSEENGWILVQDTAWPGYEKIPTWIIEGYLTLAKEAGDALKARGIRPTHVLLQAGVGSMAGGVLDYMQHCFGDVKGVIVEPWEANCIYRSAEAADGEAHTVGGLPETIMAGLNCGTPCSVIWPVLRDQAFGYCSCRDEVTVEGMRRYAHPLGGDPAVVAGESAAVTLGVVIEAAQDEALKAALGLDETSQILLISTEGDTDPENYKKIVEES